MGQPQVRYLYFPAKTQTHPHNNIPHPQDIHTHIHRGVLPLNHATHKVTTVVINNNKVTFLQLNLNAEVLLGVQLSLCDLDFQL